MLVNLTRKNHVQLVSLDEFCSCLKNLDSLTTVNDHLQCGSGSSTDYSFVGGCKWPMFHQCTQEILEYGTFSGVPLLSSAEPGRYKFRSDSAKESATYNTPNNAVVSTMH